MSQQEYELITQMMGGLLRSVSTYHKRRDFKKRDAACQRYDELALLINKARSNPE